MRPNKIAIVGAVAALLALGGGIAAGASTSQPVACTYDGATLSCPMPQQTVTRTVTSTAKTTVVSTTTVTVTASTTPATTATAASTPATTVAQPSTYPDASNTGVPAGTVLTTYNDSGACHLTTPGAVYDAQTFNCDLIIEAAGIKITRSNIVGRVASTAGTGESVTISDSKIDGGLQETFPTVGQENITLLRDNIIGGEHSVQCWANCTVTDSWLHQQYLPSTSAGHVNAFISNGGSNFTLTHNTLDCTVTATSAGGGCTADASLFGDFGAISNVTFDRNLFVSHSTQAGYCTQAGYNPGKSYPTPSNVKYTGNTFQRGGNSKCGQYGAVTAYLAGNGDVWTGNTWDDGTTLPAQ